MGNTTELDKILELGQRIQQLSDKINQYDIPRTNFSVVLEDEKLLAAYHKEFGKIAKPLAYVRNLRKQFAQWYKSNAQLAIDEVRKRLNILINLTNLFSPNEILRLRRIELMLGRTEIDEIHKCVADVQRWTSFALRNREQAYRIDFFFNRLAIYIRGGLLDGVQFLGLYAHYKDAELTKELLDNEQVKRLRMYKKQMQFFRMAQEVITHALKNPGWEGFLGKDGFYYNLRHGKKYIKTVREQFENEEFAAYLERLDKNIHEAPEAWGGSLLMLSKKLNDPDYQNARVIHPAMEALLALFQKAIERVSRSEVGFKEVDGALEKLERDIERKMVKLREQIAQLRNEFNKIDNEVADEMSIVMPALIDYAVKLGYAPGRRLDIIRRTADASERWWTRYGADFDKLFANQVPVGAAFFDAAQADKISAIETQQIDAPLISKQFESWIDVIGERVNLRLIPKLQKIVDFVRQHDSEFAIQISTTREFIPEIKDYIKKNAEQIDYTKPRYG